MPHCENMFCERTDLGAPKDISSAERVRSAGWVVEARGGWWVRDRKRCGSDRRGRGGGISGIPGRTAVKGCTVVCRSPRGGWVD